MEILLTLAGAVDNGVGEIKYLDDGICESDDDRSDYDGTTGAFRRLRHPSARNQRDSSAVRNGTGQPSPMKRTVTRRSPQVEHLLVESSSAKSSMKRSASTSFEPFVRKEESVGGAVKKQRPRSYVKQRTPEYADEAELATAVRSAVSDSSDLSGNVSRLRARFSASPYCLKAGSSDEAEGKGPDDDVNSRARAQEVSPGEFRDLLSKLFWVASAVLHSDYEHEFLMAVRLMNKVGVVASFLLILPNTVV